MCGLFGVVNYGNAKEETVIGLVKSLGKMSESRGTDASGIAFYDKKTGALRVEKSAKAFSKFKTKKFDFGSSPFVMGHTRATTQGNANKNSNNHPFLNKYKSFAMAHNGIISNDEELKHEFNLKYDIETDSYIFNAVLDHLHDGVVTFDSIQDTIERIDGMYNFTILDKHQNLWIAKHNNPLYVLRINDLGLIVYASTEEILFDALHEYFDLTKYLITRVGTTPFADELPTVSGDILKIDSKGNITGKKFTPHARLTPYNKLSRLYYGNTSYYSTGYNYGDNFDYYKRHYDDVWDKDDYDDSNFTATACGYEPFSKKGEFLFENTEDESLVSILFSNVESGYHEQTVISARAFDKIIKDGEGDVYSYLWGSMVKVQPHNIISKYTLKLSDFKDRAVFSDMFASGESAYIKDARAWAKSISTLSQAWVESISDNIDDLDDGFNYARLNMMFNRILLDFYQSYKKLNLTSEIKHLCDTLENILFTLYAVYSNDERAMIMKLLLTKEEKGD